MLSNEDIKMIMSNGKSLNSRVNELIEQANEAGGTDNITVLLIDFDDELQEDTP